MVAAFVWMIASNVSKHSDQMRHADVASDRDFVFTLRIGPPWYGYGDPQDCQEVDCRREVDRTGP
jgi:hypothetical protein